MNLRMLLVVAVSVIAATSIGGCTIVDEFRTYGETVFRLQNAVMDELIGAEDFDADPFIVGAAALLAAEERIVDSCRDLNEAASILAEGRELGLPLKLRVFNSIARCEASTLAVKALFETNTALLSAASP